MRSLIQIIEAHTWRPARYLSGVLPYRVAMPRHTARTGLPARSPAGSPPPPPRTLEAGGPACTTRAARARHATPSPGVLPGSGRVTLFVAPARPGPGPTARNSAAEVAKNDPPVPLWTAAPRKPSLPGQELSQMRCFGDQRHQPCSACFVPPDRDRWWDRWPHLPGAHRDPRSAGQAHQAGARPGGVVDRYGGGFGGAGRPGRGHPVHHRGDRQNPPLVESAEDAPPPARQTPPGRSRGCHRTIAAPSPISTGRPPGSP